MSVINTPTPKAIIIMNIMLLNKLLNERRSGAIDKSPRKITLEEKERIVSCTSKDYPIRESSTSVLLTDIKLIKPFCGNTSISADGIPKRFFGYLLPQLDFSNMSSIANGIIKSSHLSTCN
jgi:hypothetical protein